MAIDDNALKSECTHLAVQFDVEDIGINIISGNDNGLNATGTLLSVLLHNVKNPFPSVDADMVVDFIGVYEISFHPPIEFTTSNTKSAV